MIQPGTYKIIRVNGLEQTVDRRPTLDAIHAAIGCDCCDSVILTRAHGQAETVMMVDDTGMIDVKPINPKATELYHSVCKPDTPYSIHGDVVIVNDEDFA